MKKLTKEILAMQSRKRSAWFDWTVLSAAVVVLGELIRPIVDRFFGISTDPVYLVNPAWIVQVFGMTKPADTNLLTIFFSWLAVWFVCMSVYQFTKRGE